MDATSEQLAGCYTGVVHDVMRAMGLRDFTFPAELRPLMPERRMAGHAQQHLDAPADHLLDQHAIDAWRRCRRAHGHKHLAIGRAQIRGVGEPEPHAADLRLVRQVCRVDLERHRIAEQIVGSIDDDGYLRRETTSIVDDLAFRQNIITNTGEVDELIGMIQQFDPPGIAARDLRECLLLQLYRKKAVNNDESTRIAIEILHHYFDEFTKKHYEKIQRGLNIYEDGLKAAIGQIIKLSPKPGANRGELKKAESYVIPDFFLYNNAGKLELTLNSRNAPDLRVSEGYREMLRAYERGSKKDKRQKEAVLFIKQKIDAAKWFIDAIRQRQHTLLSTMEAIMRHQEEFFMTGDETTLRPMILKDIAEKTDLDISTVSRVANSKFVQTEFGTYRLKFFFSESLSTESGEEVSTREVKKILSDMVAGESKQRPLSDERLTELLQQKGYNIARRTVAKYREQLNIPVARLRKEL